MSSPVYQAEFDDYYYQGYRPLLVSGYTVGGQDRYAAIWHNHAFSGADLAHIDSVAQAAMSDWSLPALSFAITRQGRLVFAKAYGYADTAAFEKARTAHRFRIASVSKPVTAVAILRLVEQGLLDLDDQVFGAGALLGTTYGTTPYGPGIEDITVRHLLTHTAGGWPNTAGDPMFSNPGLDHAQLIGWTLDNRPLDDTPGTTYAYSNFGYCVLGRVIEAVTGQAYDAWVKANVLAPVGVSTTEIAGDTLADRKPNEVVYYDDNAAAPYGMKVARMDAHGGWIARPIDLVRLAVRVDGFATKPDILAPATITTMTTPWEPGAGYALGWAVNQWNNWWHNGSLPGTSSILVRTAGELTWAAVTNTRNNGPDLDGMMWDVVNGVGAWPSHDLF
jgi:CubicO group peptidase (beta-lactamase class C family)